MSMLDLGRFSYQRRKEPLLQHRPTDGKENQSTSTPNGALYARLTSIPETPHSLLPTPPSGKLGGRSTYIPQQKKRNRISDEEETPASGNLFSGLHISKRRKRDIGDSITPRILKKEEIIEIHSDDDDAEIEPKAVTRPCKAAMQNDRKRKLLAFSFESSNNDSVFEDRVQPHKRKRADASAGKNPSTNRGLAQGTWMGRRNRTEEEVPPCQLDHLEELFPQHSQEFLSSKLEQCGSLSEAVATVLASDDIQEHSSPGDSPVKKFRRVRLVDSDDSPTVPSMSERVRLVDSDDSPTVPSMSERVRLVDLDDSPTVPSMSERKVTVLEDSDSDSVTSVHRRSARTSARRLYVDSQDLGGSNDAVNEGEIAVDGSLASGSKKSSIETAIAVESNKVEPFSSQKGSSEQILDSCLQLLGECQKISTNISQIQTSGGSSTSGDVYPSQPAILNTSLQLKPYQLEGLNWLALMHSQNLNGILADEMGLGKTVQAIAFLAHLYEQGCRGPFLIVVPSSTLENWARELETWCPSLSVVTYWGSQEERSNIRYDVLYGEGEPEFEVFLSSYSVCIGQPEDRKFFRRQSLQCLILDEGHMLKNMTSQRYSYLMKMKAKRCVLLTGTPLQNDLLELMSLLNFIMPDVFQKYSDQLKKTFSRANFKKLVQSGTHYQEQLEQAKQLIKPFILRRLKSEVLSQLPAKFEHTEHCSLGDLQRQVYTRTSERSKEQLRTIAGGNCRSKLHANCLMELRKVANHPLLVRHHYCDVKLRAMAVDILKDPSHRDANPDLVFEDMSVMSDFELHRLCLTNQALSGHALSSDVVRRSGKFAFLARKLNDLKEQGDRVLLFSQFTTMLDIVECFLEQEGHAYLRMDGQTPVTRRQLLIDQYNRGEDIFIFLLSTKAGGLGINLTSANVVILHDIDFNPYNDKQAEDRCHRVGQKRDVHVIRLISEGTIEEEMLQCAQKKLKLEQDINLADEGTGSSESDIASLIMQGL